MADMLMVCREDVHDNVLPVSKGPLVSSSRIVLLRWMAQ